MENHPIESIMNTTLGHLKEMTDVNSVVGTPVFTDEGTVVIPISKVGFGFVAGGGEYETAPSRRGSEELPFAGGAGAGVSVSPDGFLVISGNEIHYLPVQKNETLDKVFGAIPHILEQIRAMCGLPKEPSSSKSETPHNPTADAEE